MWHAIPVQALFVLVPRELCSAAVAWRLEYILLVENVHVAFPMGETK